MKKSEQINELSAALAKAQGEMRGAKADSSNPFFHSSYADLGSVWEACRGPLSKNGLSVIQVTDLKEGSNEVYLLTTLSHSSGQWVTGMMPIRPVKNDPQAFGSALTYARRYALSAVVGIAPYDDDGETSMGRGESKGMIPPGNGKQIDHSEYLIPGSTGTRNPLAGKRPIDCDPIRLREEILKVEEKYKGKVLPPSAIRFIQECEPLVAAFENQHPLAGSEEFFESES